MKDSTIGDQTEQEYFQGMPMHHPLPVRKPELQSKMQKLFDQYNQKSKEMQLKIKQQEMLDPFSYQQSKKKKVVQLINKKKDLELSQSQRAKIQQLDQAVLKQLTTQDKTLYNQISQKLQIQSELNAEEVQLLQKMDSIRDSLIQKEKELDQLINTKYQPKPKTIQTNKNDLKSYQKLLEQRINRENKFHHKRQVENDNPQINEQMQVNQGDQLNQQNISGNTRNRDRFSRNVRKLDIVVLFTLTTIVNCLVQNYFYLIPATCQNKQFQIWLNHLLMILYTPIIFRAYYITIKTDNSIQTVTNQYQPVNPPIDPLQSALPYCQQCKSFKPLRASHCSSCGKCQMGFDHHCVFANNCIGYRNRTTFVTFVTTMVIGSWHFIVNIIRWHYLDKADSPYFSNLELLYIIANTIVVVPFAFMLVGLTFSHLLLLCNGLSTIDVMKGELFELPLVQCRSKYPPPKYDFGIIGTLGANHEESVSESEVNCFSNCLAPPRSVFCCWPKKRWITNPKQPTKMPPLVRVSDLIKRDDATRKYQIQFIRDRLEIIQISRRKFKGLRLKVPCNSEIIVL